MRGEHAHRKCCAVPDLPRGSVTVHLDDGEHRAEVAARHAATRPLIPPMVWASQFRYCADAVLLVFASHPYDPDDYIRDYGEFLALVAP